MNTDKSKSIINFLEHNAIWKCNIPLLSSTNAITLIDLCKFENKKILGIDTFRIIENAIQPLLDESIDYSISKKNQILGRMRKLS